MFNAFWDEAKKFVNEDLGVAVDDQCHGEVNHLAKAISIRDLREQVTSQCPLVLCVCNVLKCVEFLW